MIIIIVPTAITLTTIAQARLMAQGTAAAWARATFAEAAGGPGRYLPWPGGILNQKQSWYRFRQFQANSGIYPVFISLFFLRELFPSLSS